MRRVRTASALSVAWATLEQDIPCSDNTRLAYLISLQECDGVLVSSTSFKGECIVDCRYVNASRVAIRDGSFTDGTGICRTYHSPWTAHHSRHVLKLPLDNTSTRRSLQITHFSRICFATIESQESSQYQSALPICFKSLAMIHLGWMSLRRLTRSSRPRLPRIHHTRRGQGQGGR